MVMIVAGVVVMTGVMSGGGLRHRRDRAWHDAGDPIVQDG
jgi:hypothetical protein